MPKPEDEERPIFASDEEDDFDEYDEGEGFDFDCSMAADGSCGAAGSEDCEFECPYRRQQRASYVQKLPFEGTK